MAVSPFNDMSGGGGMPPAAGPSGGAQSEDVGSTRGQSNDMYVQKTPTATAMGLQMINPLVRTDHAISTLLPPKVEEGPGE